MLPVAAFCIIWKSCGIIIEIRGLQSLQYLLSVLLWECLPSPGLDLEVKRQRCALRNYMSECSWTLGDKTGGPRCWLWISIIIAKINITIKLGWTLTRERKLQIFILPILHLLTPISDFPWPSVCIMALLCSFYCQLIEVESLKKILAGSDPATNSRKQG